MTVRLVERFSSAPRSKSYDSGPQPQCPSTRNVFAATYSVFLVTLRHLELRKEVKARRREDLNNFAA